ncbi:inositol monophosphatase [Humibacillus sp. DSM 29435]|uniref:inositol monophosphatase family protein n=1 Tax=Humibacillus sp. DSM 29435 TaxID=1869167 RepID=UPI00087349A7|nr:inositol monophosphatase [Humibacillus sp. DSM 29435]OFE19074.1 inositol monophosphatase [Humibacillus sp. DSM 29435]
MDTDEVMTLLQNVADEVINPRFRSLTAGEIHEKNPGDLVTVADREAEVLITRVLNAVYPDAVVLGEEAYAGDPALMGRYLAADHAFTVDPVDGTKNFVHGSADHAVMVAETRGGQTVRSWIWQPQHGLGYAAELGGGCYRNGVRVSRETPTALTDPAELRGRTSKRSWIGASLDGLSPMTLTWVSCGIDYPKLVEGEADYILYRGAAPWDHAPGSLMLAEVGGFVGTVGGRAYQPRDNDTGGLIPAASQAAYDVVLRSLRASRLLEADRHAVPSD